MYCNSTETYMHADVVTAHWLLISVAPHRLNPQDVRIDPIHGTPVVAAEPPEIKGWGKSEGRVPHTDVSK